MLLRLSRRVDASPDAFQLYVDVGEAERRKRERVVRLNTVTVPRLRVLGYGLVSLTVLLHNHFAFGVVDWAAWGRLNLALAVYCSISWYLLHIFYSDLRKHFEAYSSVSFDNYPVRELPGEPLVPGGAW